MNRRLAAASLIGALSQGVAILLALWATPRIVHGLGDAAFALYATLGTFASYFAWLELGLGAAYVRALTASLARQDLVLAQRQVATAHSLYTRIAAAGFGLLLLTGVPLILVVDADAAFRLDAFGSLILLASAFAASMALSTARAVVFACQRADLYAKAALVIGPLVPVAQVLLLLVRPSMTFIFGVQAFANVALDVFLLFRARRLVPNLKYVAHFDSTLWAEWRSFSLAKFGSQVANQFQVSGDRLLLGVLVPLASVAPYAVAGSVSSRVRGLENALCTPFFAGAIEHHTREGEGGLYAFVGSFGGRIATLLACGLVVTSDVARPFLARWMGEPFAESGGALLTWLVSGTVAGTYLTILTLALEAQGAARASLIATLSALGVSVLAGAVFTRLLGPVGMAAAFLVGPCAGVVVALALSFARAPGIAKTKLLVRLFVVPLFVGLFIKLLGTALAALTQYVHAPFSSELRQAFATTAVALPTAVLAWRARATPTQT